MSLSKLSSSAPFMIISVRPTFRAMSQRHLTLRAALNNGPSMKRQRTF